MPTPFTLDPGEATAADGLPSLIPYQRAWNEQVVPAQTYRFCDHTRYNIPRILLRFWEAFYLPEKLTGDIHPGDNGYLLLVLRATSNLTGCWDIKYAISFSVNNIDGMGSKIDKHNAFLLGYAQHPGT